MKQKSVTISKRLCLLIGICLVFSLCVPSIAHAQEIKTVRVGYYENEIFQEGAQEAGMNGHLAKPYDINAIMQTLSAILNNT